MARERLRDRLPEARNVVSPVVAVVGSLAVWALATAVTTYIGAEVGHLVSGNQGFIGVDKVVSGYFSHIRPSAMNNAEQLGSLIGTAVGLFGTPIAAVALHDYMHDHS